jgi:hypothetical protein
MHSHKIISIVYVTGAQIVWLQLIIAPSAFLTKSSTDRARVRVSVRVSAW